jgi:hypothetical protein
MENENPYPKFILSVQDNMARMSIRHANYILGSKKNLYRLVHTEGWFLPSKESRCITSKYLFDVINGSVFRIKQEHIRPYITEQIRLPKIDLITILSGLTNSPLLGFEPHKLPNREWILSVIHTYDSNNEVFTGTKTIDKIVQIPVR